MRKHAAFAVCIALLAGIAAAGDQPAGKRFTASIDQDGVQRVSMTAGEYYFDPSVVVVKVNVPVELTIRKTGGIAPHDFVLKAAEAGLDVSLDLSSEPKKVSFMPARTGVYPFDCTKRFLFFKSHKERGMHGVLEVVE